MINQCNWAAILAGGDGQRLQSLTRTLTGDTRPKQFCRLFGPRTLLDETRSRVALNVEPARTLYVVTRAHEAFYRSDLTGVRRWQLVEQPTNRGTTAAVIYTLARLRALGAEGVVGLFPADHYYQDSRILQRTVSAAYALAGAHPNSVVLLGAEADHAETDYGWIEPGQPVEFARPARTARPVARTVTRFCEKPSPELANELMARHCLWNTLVVVGKIRAFEDLIAETAPAIWNRFAALRGEMTPEDEAETAAALYRELGSSDFSHDVLARQPERLTVINLPEAGWTDLGQPSRALAAMTERERAPRLRRVPHVAAS